MKGGTSTESSSSADESVRDTGVCPNRSAVRMTASSILRARSTIIQDRRRQGGGCLGRGRDPGPDAPAGLATVGYNVASAVRPGKTAIGHCTC